MYPLPELLLLCLLAVLAGAETFVDIARFGEKKIELLRRFRPFRHGTPAHDHLGDIVATLDAEQFQKADYVLALKGNQGTLREDVALFAAEQKAKCFKDAKVSRHPDRRRRSRPHRNQNLHRDP